MTYVLAKSLSRSLSGRLTRNFIARYGRDRDVARSLMARFMSRSYWGNSSDFHQQLRTEAREWRIDEPDRVVRRWIDEYIGWLDVETALSAIRHILGREIDESFGEGAEFCRGGVRVQNRLNFFS